LRVHVLGTAKLADNVLPLELVAAGSESGLSMLETFSLFTVAIQVVSKGRLVGVRVGLEEVVVESEIPSHFFVLA